MRIGKPSGWTSCLDLAKARSRLRGSSLGFSLSSPHQRDRFSLSYLIGKDMSTMVRHTVTNGLWYGPHAAFPCLTLSVKTWAPWSVAQLQMACDTAPLPYRWRHEHHGLWHSLQMACDTAPLPYQWRHEHHGLWHSYKWLVIRPPYLISKDMGTMVCGTVTNDLWYGPLPYQ